MFVLILIETRSHKVTYHQRLYFGRRGHHTRFDVNLLILIGTCQDKSIDTFPAETSCKESKSIPLHIIAILTCRTVTLMMRMKILQSQTSSMYLSSDACRLSNQ